MKKVILILMLVALCCSCVTASKPKTKTEIKVGQVWKWTFNGVEREVLEVGKKYVVFCYKEGYKSPDVETREDFLENHKLVQDVKCLEGYIYIDDAGNMTDIDANVNPCGPTATADYDSGVFTIVDLKPTKPYLHKNPNNDHWICSKHGDLMPDYKKDGLVGLYYLSATVTVFDSPTYCMKCFQEIINTILNQHITGVKEL